MATIRTTLLLPLSLVLLGACSSATPKPASSLHFDMEFTLEERGEQFARDWEAALSHREFREALQARLLIGDSYITIDGNEMLALSKRQPILVRHTNGGDQNPDGTWGPGCFGSRIQNRLGVIERIRELRPTVPFVEIRVEDNVGCSPAAETVSRWARERYRTLVSSGPAADLDYFRRFWGITVYDRELATFNEAAKTPWARRRAIRDSACDGWTWAISPLTPFIMVWKDGGPLRLENGSVAYVDGVTPLALGDDARDVLSSYIRAYRDSEDRDAYLGRQLSATELQATDDLAEFMLRKLGL